MVARHGREQVKACAQRLRIPTAHLRESRGRLEALAAGLAAAATARAAEAAGRLKVAHGRLDTLNPLAVLARGYSITTRASEDRPLTDAAAVPPGTRLKTRLHRGSILSRVTRSMEKTHGEEENDRKTEEDV